MGTQTDLTAEQISQMEKDLENKTTKIAELTKEQNELTNQITQKETEINQLKEQAKDLEPNDTEKKLIGIVISSQGY
jgi:septal ring factor EnvC (AmiA/AmiB activator)